jgi:hypothetical protein
MKINHMATLRAVDRATILPSAFAIAVSRNFWTNF